MADPALRVKVRWASGTVGLLPSDAFSSSRCLLRGRLPFFSHLRRRPAPLPSSPSRCSLRQFPAP